MPSDDLLDSDFGYCGCKGFVAQNGGACEDAVPVLRTIPDDNAIHRTIMEDEGAIHTTSKCERTWFLAISYYCRYIYLYCFFLRHSSELLAGKVVPLVYCITQYCTLLSDRLNAWQRKICGVVK